MLVTNARHIYFLGIGGIGMSALARYFHMLGKQVSGYDRTSSVVTRALEAEGINVFYELDPKHLDAQDVMVYTPAIKEDNIEFQRAKALGLPIKKRSQVLGEISRDYKTLAVAGTHGKTTTSILLTQILRYSGVECTAFLGGISRNLDSNFAFGQSDFMVTEADEYDRSFLTLSPWASVITSLDPDHLDIYGTAEEMKATYLKYASQVSEHVLVHEAIVSNSWGKSPLSYGIEAGNYQAKNVRFEGLNTFFDYESPTAHIQDIRLPLAGHHNVLNAVGAMGLAELAGASVGRFKEALAEFKGIYRRFEVKYHSDEFSYIDDYAHHPSEIDAAIQAGRSLFPNRKLIVVFQPHLYTRTRDFQQGFAETLSQADQLVMLPIYPAREKPIEGITAELVLKQATNKTKQMSSKTELLADLGRALNQSSVLMTLGAGDIDREVEKITNWITTI